MPSKNRATEVTADAYLDLDARDGAAGYKYQFLNPERISIYNGSENFVADKNSGKLFVDSRPQLKTYGSTLLQNSPLALKFALPKLIADKAVPKKLSMKKIAGRDHYVIGFSLQKRAINSGGEIFELRDEQTTMYSMAVDAKTFLPAEVVQSNDRSDESITVTFSQIAERPVPPDALSWYYSSYQKEYKLEIKNPLTLISADQAAPAFELAQYGTDSRSSLVQHAGKVVLLEFWIAHCGFCISAVPKLNTIAGKFRALGLQVVSINMYDPAATIELFKKNTNPEYTILTGGDSIATAYGVEAYPAFVLIGRSGKVVYSSSGLREPELEAAIVQNLQE
jgi:thiol-disulfide isomerase/thioredoxin